MGELNPEVMPTPQMQRIGENLGPWCRDQTAGSTSPEALTASELPAVWANRFPSHLSQYKLSFPLLP